MGKALCIDVGGTRIKASVLPERLSHAALEKQQLYVAETLGWLNQSLPELLSTGNPLSLVNQSVLADDYDDVGICVPGPVRNGEFLRPDLDVPLSLAQEFAKVTDKRLTLAKDADAWIIGATTYLKLINQKIHYPVVGLTLGTGAGLAVAIDADHFVSIEVSALQNQFPETERASGLPIGNAWQVHSVVGNRFFDWVRSDKRHWTRRKIEDEYSKRVIAFLHDFLRSSSSPENSVKTILLGGGNSGFVSSDAMENDIGCNVRILSALQSEIDVNLLSLIGLHRLVFSGSLRIGE